MTNESSIITERGNLMQALTTALGDTVCVVSDDATAVKPVEGKLAVLILPPEIAFDSWQFVETSWSVIIVSAALTDAATALTQILTAVETLQQAGLNIKKASPVTFNPQTGSGLPAYQVDFNPLEF